MRAYFNILFLIAISINVFAQKENIQWSEEYEDGGYYSIIGESSDAFFVERKYNTSQNDRDVDIELMRFNKDLELTHAIEVKEIETSSYQSIATINSPEGLAHIYYQTSKMGQQLVSAQLFDHKTLRKTEIVDLAKFDIIRSSEQKVYQDENYQFTFPLDILQSRDLTKLAIVYDQEKAGKKKRNFHQYCVIDLANGFSIIQKGDFYSDERSNKYSISDKHLSNSGKLTYAIKRFVKNNSIEHINKKPAYDYEIHHMSGDSSEYIYDIKVRKEFLDELTLSSDDEDNLYIAGYYRKQPFGGIKKSFLMSLDALGYERYTSKESYTRRDVKQIQGKEDNELDENYQTLDIFATDEIVYVVRQYRRRGSRNNGFNNGINNGYYSSRYNTTFNNVVYYWNYDGVVVDGVGKETGEILWTTVNQREHEDDNTYSRYFITGQMELFQNNLVFIYNEREENIQRIRQNESLKRTDIPGDRTAITLAWINPNGDLRYDVLEAEDHFHLPERGAFLGKDQLYFFNHHKNYKRFHVGKIGITTLKN